MSRKTILSFAAIGAGALLLLGVAAWSVRPQDAPIPPTGAARSTGASSRMAQRSERPCLAAPTDAGEDEMVASAGLDPDVVRTVMRAAVQGTLSCFRGAPSAAMVLSINVACSGRVASVDIGEEGGATAEVQQCVRAALRNAEFPQHALPDGEVFEYPLNYTAPDANLP